MPAEVRTVIRDVSLSLKAKLKQEVPELSDDSFISFDSPGDMEVSSTAKLSLFLYSLTENAYSRNRDWTRLDSEPDCMHMKLPPVILDLHYLLTPYAKDRETEMLILGKIIQIFYEYPVLKGADRKGNLGRCGNDEIRITPNNLPIQDIRHLWEGFPGKPMKPCLSYLATPVIMPSEKIETVKRALKINIIPHIH